jgi:Domain of unknown function (DUF4177)
MIEYKVRARETGGTADIEKVCNDLAKDGWRLVSTAAANAGGITVRVWLFFEREAGEQRAPQESWRTQHRGEDDV